MKKLLRPRGRERGISRGLEGIKMTLAPGRLANRPGVGSKT